MATLDMGTEIPAVVSNCVRDSVISIFNTIFGSEPKLLPANGANTEGHGVVGIISFVGEITWFLMLNLPQASASDMAKKFTGFDVEYDSPDMGDVVGELANVLAGDIVGRLSKEGVKVAMSLPTIMRGNNVEPLLPRGIPSSKLNFTSSSGDFCLKLAGSKPGQTVCRIPGT